MQLFSRVAFSLALLFLPLISIAQAANFTVSGAQILDPDGKVWVGRGANVNDNQMAEARANILARMPGTNLIRIPSGQPYGYPGCSHFDDMATWAQNNKVVILIENHPFPAVKPYTGSDLTTESTWYRTIAACYTAKPYVWFGTLNEPDYGPNDHYNDGFKPGITAQQVATYNAIRSASNNNIITLQSGIGGGNPGTVGSTQMDPSQYSGMRSVILEMHYYGWIPGYSDQNQTDVNNGLIGSASSHSGILGSQTLQSADGTMPVLIGEFSPQCSAPGGPLCGLILNTQQTALNQNTLGQGFFGQNGDQVTAAVPDVGVTYGKAGYIGWSWNADATSQITSDAGASLTPYWGAKLKNSIAATAAAFPGLPPSGGGGTGNANESAECTIINATGQNLTDGGGNTYAINANKQILFNGAVVSATANVVEIAYTGHTAYQLNSSNTWYSMFPAAGGGMSGGTGTTTSPLPVGCSSGSGNGTKYAQTTAGLKQFLVDTEGKHISGQYIERGQIAPVQTIHTNTGKWLGQIAIDYWWYGSTQATADCSTANSVSKDYWANGGLIMLTTHMSNPSPASNGRVDDPTMDWTQLLTQGTPTNTNLMTRLSSVADCIQDLKNSGVKVIYRPYHEANIRSFWWGTTNGTNAQFIQLWKLTHDYLVNTRGLDNILFMLVTNGGAANARYAGAFYVDVASIDAYSSSPINYLSDYTDSASLGLPVMISEFGAGSVQCGDTSFDLQTLVDAMKQMPKLMGWANFGDGGSASCPGWGMNANTNVKAALSDPTVLNRGDLAYFTAPAVGESFSFDAFPVVTQGTAFTVSGKISGATAAPTLQYQDNGGGWLALPSGAQVNSTTFSFSHPAMTANPAATVAVRDANNTAASQTGPPFVVKGTETAECTQITAINTPITDSAGNTYSINSSGQIVFNGSPVAATANVVLIAYTNHLAYQKNASGTWYSMFSQNGTMSGSAGSTTSPLPASCTGGGSGTPPTNRITAPLTGTVTPGNFSGASSNFGGTVVLPSGKDFYWQFAPPPNLDTTKLYPLFVFLHANGAGYNHYAGSGIDLSTQTEVQYYNTVGEQTVHPMAIALPYADQTDDGDGGKNNWSGWDPANQPTGSCTVSGGSNGPNTCGVLKMVAKLLADNPWIDPNRVYVGGPSLGAIGTLYFMDHYGQVTGDLGQVFTAGVAMSGAEEVNGYGKGVTAPQIARFKGGHLWMTNGATDTDSIASHTALPLCAALLGNTNYPSSIGTPAQTLCGGDVHLSYLAGVGHTWFDGTPGPTTFFGTKPNIENWLYSQINTTGTVTPPPSEIISISGIATQQAGQSFSVNGTIANATKVPTLQYSDDQGITWHPMIPAAP